jgi:hypothetical protein
VGEFVSGLDASRSNGLALELFHALPPSPDQAGNADADHGRHDRRGLGNGVDGRQTMKTPLPGMFTKSKLDAINACSWADVMVAR